METILDMLAKLFILICYIVVTRVLVAIMGFESVVIGLLTYIMYYQAIHLPQKDN